MRKGLILTAAAVAMAAAVACAQENRAFRLGRNAEIMVNLLRELDLFYVDTLDIDGVVQDAADGITASLDPYTEYLPAKDMADFETMTTGKYGGIGSIIRPKGDYVVIDQPYKGFPADKAGLQSGDRIVSIDGKEMKGEGVATVSGLMRGEPGSKFTLVVDKLITGERQTLVIERERVAISGVPYYGYLADSIGYIALSDFTEGCGEDVLRAFVALRRQGTLGGLVLDMRGNGGGILQEAVRIVSMFVPRGTEVVSMKGRTRQMSNVFRTQNDPVDASVPLVVLIDGGSASASEIVAGALQDLDRAVLVGQRTFGKGLVQSPRPLGYNTFVKLTTARYYTPAGRYIQALDYAHRSGQGAPSRTPDSLVREYRTAAGRKVYDGGGIMPDVRLEPHYINRFAAIAYSRGYVSEFVDDYMVRHGGPKVDATGFGLDSAEYGRFVDFMADKDMDYESPAESTLTQLRAQMAADRSRPEVVPLIDSIGKLLRRDVRSELQTARKDLTRMIEQEIVRRGHYVEGVSRRSVADDAAVLEAAAILRDRDRYVHILTEKDTDRK